MLKNGSEKDSIMACPLVTAYIGNMSPLDRPWIWSSTLATKHFQNDECTNENRRDWVERLATTILLVKHRSKFQIRMPSSRGSRKTSPQVRRQLSMTELPDSLFSVAGIPCEAVRFANRSLTGWTNQPSMAAQNIGRSWRHMRRSLRGREEYSITSKALDHERFAN